MNVPLSAADVRRHDARRRYVIAHWDALRVQFPDEFVAIDDDGNVVAHAPTIDELDSVFQAAGLSAPRDVGVEFIGTKRDRLIL